MEFPSDIAEAKNKFEKEQAEVKSEAIISESVMSDDSLLDGETLDSDVGFDDHEIMDTAMRDRNLDTNAGRTDVLDEEDGKDSQYLDRLKSVFGDS